MIRTLVALVLSVLATASVASAGDLRRGSIVPRVGPIVPHGPNIVPNPPPERVPRHVVPRHPARPGFVIVTPPPVIVYAAPRECTSQGYWTYQWVPATYAESYWVPGGWTAEGAWADGRYEQRAYASGYYQPYWVPGHTYAC